MVFAHTLHALNPDADISDTKDVIKVGVSTENGVIVTRNGQTNVEKATGLTVRLISK
jgi:hypothetical protein